MVSKQKILIVDDDENIAELISLYLTKECFETMIVGDGESALSAVNTFEPNLILLDLMLPGIDGYQVCREVRAKNQVPIIILSAKGEVFDKVLGLEMGADDFIQTGRSRQTRCQRKMRGISGFNHQPDQLLRYLYGSHSGHAPQGAGASVLLSVLSQPCFHQRAAPGPDLGL